MRKMLFIIFIILAVSGCSASEIKLDYKGYIIDILELEESMVYQIMWGISEDDVKTKTAGDLNEYNSHRFIMVQFDENNKKEDSFKIGDRVSVQVVEVQPHLYKLKKIELDKSDEQ